MDETVENSPLTTNTEIEWNSNNGLDQKVKLKMEIDIDHQVKLEPSFVGEEEIHIDGRPHEDSKEYINRILQNNELTIINFSPIKEEGSNNFIKENKQNNELQLSSSTRFPLIKEEIKTELNPSTLYLPSQVTDVLLPCKYSNLEKYSNHKEEKRNSKLMGQKNNIFLNDSAVCENSTRSGQDIVKKKHVNFVKKICDFKDYISKHNNTNQNLIHTLNRNYMCNVCNKDFKEKKSLNKHLLVHTQQRKYKCNVCAKSFKVKGTLNSHLLSHSDQRKYKCDVCDKSFKMKSNLNRHLLIHSDQRKYKCNVCAKSFKVKANLNSHLFTHSDQRNYNCDVCDKSFKVKANLNIHLFTHSDQRNYNCYVCDKSFKVKGDLNRHLLIHSEQGN